MCLMALSNAFGAVTRYLTEDFESGQIPAGWTQEVESSNVASWVIEPTSSATYPATGNASNYYVALRNLTGIDQHYVVKLITPAIDFTSFVDQTQPQLLFKHAQVGAGTFFDTLKVYARSSATAPWVLLRTFDSRIDQWTEDTIALTGFSGSTAYQVGFEIVENMGRGIVLDDVRVTNMSTCVAPSNVAMTIPGTTSVTLAWAGGLETDTFEVVVSASAITDWSSYTAVYHGFSADFSEVVTGLNPQTDYYAYVRANCTDNETGWTQWAMGQFRTRARIEIPYSEAFSTSLPEGWTTKSTVSGKPSFSAASASASTLASFSVDSTFAMQFGGITAGKYACAITPEINVPSLQNVEVGFWGFASTYIQTPFNTYVGKMYVGVMDDPEDSASLVIVDSVEIKVANKHEHFNVSFMGYNGTGKYLAFIVTNPTRSAYFYIDHLTITQPAVLTPTDVQITNATPDGFDVTVNLHGASQWNLRVADGASYKHMNVLPTSFLVSQDGITGNTFHVAGEFGETIVAVYAQAVSGQNTSAWSFPTTLRIPARATLPLAYEFDNTADASVLVKSLDNEIHVNSTVKTFPGLYFPLLDLSNFYPKHATGTPKYENSSHMTLQGLNQWVALPYVDSFAGQMVSFRLAASTAGQSRVAVGIMKDAYDLSTFTKLTEFSGPYNEYMKCEVDLSGLDSLGHYVAIMAIKPSSPSSSLGSVNQIDALHIEPIPACPEALEIETSIADTAITLTWNPRGMNHWLVELFAGSNPDSLLASVDVTTPEATIGGLTSLTDYYYRVNTWCGEDTLHGNGKIKFTTKCDLVSTFPWSEDFNDLGTGNLALDCWVNEHTAGSATTKFSVTTTTYAGNATKKLYTASMTAGNKARLTLPEMIFPNTHYEFLISVYRNSTSPTKTTEGLRIFASDGENETELAFIPRVVTASSSTVLPESADDWYTYEFPIGISGNGMIIIQAEGDGGAAIYMDDFVVREIPSCPKVNMLTISNITDNSAVANWTPRGNESQWQYLLIVPGEEIDWSNAVTVNSPTVSLTGLTSSTSYDFYVRAYCGTQDQSEAALKSFRTDCGVITTLPWSDGFEAYAIGSATNQTLDCWTILGAAATTSTYPQVFVNNSSTYVKSGSKSLYFKSSKDSCVYVVFPPFAAPLNTLKIAFSHKEENVTNSGIPVVGYVTDPNDASTFVALAEYTRLKEWQDEELMLSAVPAEVASTARLAFRYGGGPNNNYYMGIDDITISEVDFSCPGINELTATSPSSNSISIAWTSPGTQAVDIEISDSANFAVTRLYPAVPTSPLVLDSMEQNHYYYVRARQVCDTEGEWKSTVVKTLCDPVNPETYPVQDFEAAGDLDCWLVGVSLRGKQPSDNPSIGSLAARGKYLYFNKAATTSDTITKGDGLYAIMPMLDVDSITKYEVSFKAFMTSTAAANAGKLAIGVITDPSDFSTFTLVQNLRLEYAADSLSEKEYTVNFLNYTGDSNDDYGKYIVFYAQSGDSANAIGVDKVTVRTVATCPQIAAGTISDITSDGAIYRWPGTGAAAYEVRILTERVDPDQAEIIPSFIDTVAVDSAVISGLSSARTYYAYVRALCGPNDVSRWSTYTRFRTLCGVAHIPYEENFNEAEALDCFVKGNMQSSASAYIPSLNTSSTYLYDGMYSLKIYAYNGSSTHADSAYVILPEMNFGAKGLKAHTLKLFGRSYGTTTSYYKHLQIGVVSGEDMKTFQLIRDVTLTDLYAPIEVSFEEYTGTGNRIALMTTRDPSVSATSTSYSYAYLDDITVFPSPTCKSIESIEATPGRRTIDVKITPKMNGIPDHYDLVCSTTELDEAALDAADKMSVDTTGKYTITGLDRETLYYLYARANCGLEDGTSEWSSLSITTKGLYGCDDYKTVGDGTTTGSGPICGLYGYERKGFIFTPEDGLIPGRIGSLAWDFSGNAAKPIPCKIYLKNTSETQFVSTLVWNTLKSDATLVYEGTASITAGLNEFEITPFLYTGGNLMILVESNVTGTGGASVNAYYTASGSNNYFYIRKDTEINDNQAYSDFSTKGMNNQRSNTRFGFCYDVAPCPTISDLSTELLGTGISEAMLRWTASEGDYLSGYDVIVSDTVVAQPDSITPTYANVQGDSLQVTGLSPETLYYVYVRAICKAEGHDEGTSTWVETAFETLANCPAVVGLTSELSTAATTVKLTWETAFEDQELHFAYVYATDSLDADSLAVAQKTFVNDTLACEISNLAYGQKYYFYVASVCGASFSPWSQTEITTDAACAPVRNLEIARLEHNLVVLQWNRSRFGSETQWEAGIVGDSASIVYVSDSSDIISAMIIGLTPETQYTAYVRTICGEGQVSEIVTLPFTTKAWFGSCVTIGEGTTSGYSVPFDNYYKNAWTQSIYTADQVGSAGLIGSIQYQVAAAPTSPFHQAITIYLAHTTMDLASTTSSWVPQGDLVEVYSNTDFVHPMETGWMEIPLNSPFDYNGSDNLAVVISTYCTEYSSTLKFAYTAGTSGVSLYRGSDTSAAYHEYPGTTTGTKSTNLPNVQFCFAQAETCLPVTALTVHDVTTTTAVASWEPLGNERSWEVCLADSTIFDFTGLRLDTVYNYVYPMANLLDDKDYWFYVRPICGGDWRVQKFTTVALCSAPIELDYDSVTSDHALLSWTDAFSVGSSYIVAIGLADSLDLNDSTTYTTIQVQTPYVRVTGLEEVTMYAFAVRSVCEGGLVSRFSEIATFQTPCAVKPQYWYDGFENQVYCWYVGNRNSSSSTYIPGIINSSTTASNAIYVHSGVRAFKMYAYKSSSTSADSAYVIVPEIDYGPAGLQGSAIRFYARSQGTSSSTTDYFKHVEIGVIKNRSIRTYQKVKDVAITDQYDMYEVSFADYVGDGDRIVFLAKVDPTSTISSRYCYVYFDDFEVIDIPTCWRPKSISIVNTVADSVSFVWTPGGSETQWQYVCVPYGMTPDWSNAILTDTTAATIDGLGASSSYEIYVRAYCSATDQSQPRSTVFATECGVVNVLPWAEGFEAYEAGTYSATAVKYVPACWDMVKSSAATNYPHVAAASTYVFPHSGYNALVTYTTDSCIATLPAFDANLNDLQISFYYRTYNVANCGLLVLGYVTPDGEFHQIKTYSPTTKVTKDKVLLNTLPASLTARLAFLYTGGTSSMYNVSLDDIVVDYIDYSCAGVSDVQVSEFTRTTATIQWDYTLGHRAAQVQIAADANFEFIVDSASVINDSIYMSTGLDLGTVYYVRARQICGEDEYSEWSEVITFTTSYGVPFRPRFNNTSIPTDWMRSNTTADQVFAGQDMATETAGWALIAADTIINSYHFRGNIYGTSWHHWVVTPAIDLTPNVGEGLILSFDAALTPFGTGTTYDNNLAKMYTCVDDRFLVAVSTDGGNTWNPANVTEWNNSGTGQFVYNDVPMVGTKYMINMSDYAGSNVKIGFYGESSVANADNYFHFGNIHLESVETVTFVDTICEGYSFSKNGFDVPYDQLIVGLNAVSRYEMDSTGAMKLTIQQILVNPTSMIEIPVTLCEGEHFNDYGFDVTVTQSETIRKRIDGGNQFGCDSTAILQITMLPTIRTELHVGCNEDSYTWHGKTYYQSVIVDDTTSSAVTGCDSITTLFLTFCDGKVYRYHNAFCQGGSYTDEFFENLTAPGEYSETIIDEIGCVTKAELTLHQLASGQNYVDSVHVSDLPYVLGNDTLCPETDQPGFVYHGSGDFGCGMVTVTIYVYDIVGLNNIAAGALQVAPNPVRIGEDIKILTAVDLTSDYSCRVFDAVGKLVYETDKPSTIIPGLPVAGAYTIRITAGTTIYQGKLIVK